MKTIIFLLLFSTGLSAQFKDCHCTVHSAFIDDGERYYTGYATLYDSTIIFSFSDGLEPLIIHLNEKGQFVNEDGRYYRSGNHRNMMWLRYKKETLYFVYEDLLSETKRFEGK